MVFLAYERFDFLEGDVSLLRFKGFRLQLPSDEPVRYVDVVFQIFCSRITLEQIADRDFQDLLRESIASLKGRNVKAITALLDVDTLKASNNQKEDITAALKVLTEAEDSKMLFGEPEPKPAGTGNLIGQIQKSGTAQVDTLKGAIAEHYNVK